MKSILLAGTFLGTLATVALAADSKPLSYGATGPVMGFTSWWAGAGAWNDDYNDYSGNFFAVGGDSRVNLWLNNGFSVQGDVEAEATNNGFGDCCYTEDHRILAAVGGHASWRTMSHAFGVFGGFVGSSEVDAYYTVLNSFAGVEAQAYVGAITLYGQVGVSHMADTNAYGMDSVFVRGQVRFFMTPNDKFQLEVGLARGTFSGTAATTDPAATITNWSLLYEHQFGPGPLSMFAQLSGTTLNNPADGYNPIEHQAMVGVRLHFNSSSLLQQDRQGATFDLPTGTVFRPLLWAGYAY